MGRVQFLAFDNEDRVVTNIDANGVTVTLTYDNLGRVLTRTYPDNGVEKFGYTAKGLTVYTNQLGLTNFYAYDVAGRKTFETNANWELTQFQYDPSGNLTNILYQVNSPTTLSYDPLNRLTSMVDGVGTTAYGYDAAGQVLSEDGPWPNDTVNYTYANRLRAGLTLQVPNASAWAEGFGYDNARRLTSLTSPAGAFGYTNDPVRRLQVGRITLPNGAYITNMFDNVARLLSTTLKNSGNSVLNSHTYGYNLGSQRTSLTNTAGDYRNYTYDKIGQLKTAFGKESSGTNRLQEQLGYAYDAAGNLNYRTNNALTQTFNVNNLNELTTLGRNGTLTVAGSTRINATSVTVNGLTANRFNDATFALGGFTPVNGNNSFTAIGQDSSGRQDTNSVTVYLPASPSYSYDLNGNLLGDGTRSFTYDDENQLISVVVSNGVTTSTRSDFAYDGKMRCRVRTESAWGGSSWVTNQIVRYVYDGNVVIQERDANNVPVVSYTRGKDLSGSFQGAGGIGGLLGRTDHAALNAQLSTAQAYYHADGSGNITALINTNQITVATYLYDPFGFILSQSGTLADANVYRFSGKEFHLASGLSYFLYRFYEPSLQRWLNRDPIDEDGGINLYSFVRNSTINRVDALGLLPELAPEFLNPEAVQLALELEAEELGISVEQLVAKKAAEAAAKKAAEEAAKALVKRCTKNIGKLAKQFNKTRKEIETAIHKAKKPLQRFKGKGQKSNVDVTIDPTTGEVYPEIPGGGLGDSIGNILDLF